MTGTQLATPPSPARILETLTAFQHSSCLKGAIDLGLFTVISEGHHTVSKLAARIGASERGTRILCDFLAVDGFLTKTDGMYGLTQESAVFLDRKSPAYLGTAALFLSQLHTRHYFDDVARLVREGHTIGDHEGTVGREDPIWVDFAHSMAPMMALPAQVIAGILQTRETGACKVLDIAAGHGLFGIAVAEENPLAEIWALDWPAVVAVAAGNAAAHGVAERYHTISGSAFEVEFGSGYDVVLMTNFLHHFDRAACVDLLKKVRASMNPGGRVATFEFVPNDDRISPQMPAQFAMIMLAATPGGDAYTYPELASMYEEAGFARSERFPVPPTEETLVISYA
jgi:2-polyprenyl-3-methyl-5-hydroxy-6-metoxy-1,4-benzoquinol methylase